MNDSTLDLNASTRQFEILLKKSRVVKELIANREIGQRKDAKAEIRRFIVFFNKFYDKGCQEYIGKDDYTILNKSLVTLSLCKGALKNVEFALKNKVSLDVTNHLALFFAILFAAIKGFTSCQMKGLKHGEKLSREIRAYLDNLFPGIGFKIIAERILEIRERIKNNANMKNNYLFLYEIADCLPL